MRTCHRDRFLTILALIILSVQQVSADCVKVGTAAKLAYDGQIEYIRRGIAARTAQQLYAEFIRDLATQAWQVDEFAANFSDVCLTSNYLASKTNGDGVILSMISLEAKIAGSQAKIPILPKANLANLAFDTTEVDTAWITTFAYLSDLIPPVVDSTKLIFPDEDPLRVDPHEADACYEFQQRYNTTGYSTIPADEYTSTMISIVMAHISAGANHTQALQLLKHSTAYINVGIRCLGVQKSDLAVPTIFLEDYARQSAWLSGSRSVSPEDSARKTSLVNLIDRFPNMVELLSSFQSGGRLSGEVVSAEGQLRPLNFDWNSLQDVQLTVSDSISLDFNLVQYLPTRPQVPQISISVRGPTITISHSGRNGDDKKKGLRASTIEIMKRIQSTLGLLGNNTAKEAETESMSRLDLQTTMRQTCGAGWTFITRDDNNWTDWLEQCCAPICQSASEGLSGADAALFQETCCQECNQIACADGEDAAAQGAADVVGITLPPYGDEDEESIPVMI